MKLKKIAVEESDRTCTSQKQCIIAFGMAGLVVADTKGTH
jgi:hypothetical protein